MERVIALVCLAQRRAFFLELEANSISRPRSSARRGSYIELRVIVEMDCHYLVFHVLKFKDFYFVIEEYFKSLLED